MISVSIASSTAREQGWNFNGDEATTLDEVNGARHLHEVYSKADPAITCRVTVPALWDKQEETIVNNESSEIIRMLNSEFDGLTGNNLDFYPESLRGEIDAVNEVIYETVNNGVYRTGFASTQEAYEEGYHKLFATLDEMEERLSGQRYLAGDRLTEADWRFFATLIRFDIVYYGLFKCNKRHIYEYPNLWNYTRELYQYPGVAEISNIEHMKKGYYAAGMRNPTGIYPLGPDLDYDEPHDRGRFPAADIH